MNLSFVYVGRCPNPDPHVQFRVMVEGKHTKIYIDMLQSDLFGKPFSEDEKQLLAEVLYKAAIRKWRKDNPAANFAQMRTFIEAQTFEV